MATYSAHGFDKLLKRFEHTGVDGEVRMDPHTSGYSHPEYLGKCKKCKQYDYVPDDCVGLSPECSICNSNCFYYCGDCINCQEHDELRCKWCFVFEDEICTNCIDKHKKLVGEHNCQE